MTLKQRNFLACLEDYCTALEKRMKKQKEQNTTKSLEIGQPLRVIFPKGGVFFSQILQNSNEMAIAIPKNPKSNITAQDWVGKTIHIYFSRQKNCVLFFETLVTEFDICNFGPCLFIRHANIPIYLQKRRYARLEVSISGILFLLPAQKKKKKTFHQEQGQTCKICDLSIAGAKILTKGICNSGISVLLEFEIENTKIQMKGIIRSVHFDSQKDESTIHFECLSLPILAKKTIDSYILSRLPTTQADILQAIELCTLDFQRKNG